MAGMVPVEIHFQLPPCQYFSLVCANWNLTKGPSDTATKIMDQSFQEQLGVRKPQTIATAQLILIGLVVSLHRVKQIATANVDLNWYVVFIAALICFPVFSANLVPGHQQL